MVAPEPGSTPAMKPISDPRANVKREIRKSPARGQNALENIVTLMRFAGFLCSPV